MVTENFIETKSQIKSLKGLKQNKYIIFIGTKIIFNPIFYKKNANIYPLKDLELEIIH